jgi:hypothetical protein
MTENMQKAKLLQSKTMIQSRVSFARCLLKSFLIIAAFIAMAVAPAFAALNVFTEKNRL